MVGVEKVGMRCMRAFVAYRSCTIGWAWLALASRINDQCSSILIIGAISHCPVPVTSVFQGFPLFPLSSNQGSCHLQVIVQGTGRAMQIA